MNRRTFLTTTGAALATTRLAGKGIGARDSGLRASARATGAAPGKARFRTGLVAYSYREALEAKRMTYEDLIRIAVETGTDGIDLTVYWLPGTTDDVLLPLRRLAYRNRVEIYSIGTRVRLAQPTAELREQQLTDLRKWLDVAQKLGATHVRVFGGDKPAGFDARAGDRLRGRDIQARSRAGGSAGPDSRHRGRRRDHRLRERHYRNRQAHGLAVGRHESRHRQLQAARPSTIRLRCRCRTRSART